MQREIAQDGRKIKKGTPKPVVTRYARNVKRFRGGLVLKAQGIMYHSTLGVRVIKKKRRYARTLECVSHVSPCIEP